MTTINISQKNFKRFAKRYQKLHNISLMEAQEQLSNVLGSNNYYEMINILRKETVFSYQQYNNFLWEFNNYISSNKEIDFAYFYINNERSYFGFVDTSHSEYENTITFDEYYDNSLYNITTQFYYGKNIIQLLLNHIPKGKEVVWIKGFSDFLRTLPKKDNILTENAYVLKIDYRCYEIIDNRYVYTDYRLDKTAGKYISYYQDYFSDYCRRITEEEIENILNDSHLLEFQEFVIVDHSPYKLKISKQKNTQDEDILSSNEPNNN
ncbi:hypothetical protein ACTOJ1_000441 [Shigella flexneri]